MKQEVAANQYEAILFDLDGTLLNTLEDLADSVNAALTALGFPCHSLAHFNRAVGDGAELMVERSLPPDTRDPDTLQKALEITVDEYGRRWNNKTRPYKGVSDLLGGLESAGVAKCILSNKPHEATERVVAEFLSDWTFDVVRGARDDVPIKPDPQAALEIVNSLDIPVEKWLYVGDTDTDMQTARSAGIYALGVLWGFRSKEELLENGADAIVDDPVRILELLK